MRRLVIVSNATLGIKEALEKFRSRFLGPADYLAVLKETNIDSICSKISGAYLSKAPIEDYNACTVVFAVETPEPQLDKLRSQLPGVVFLAAPFRFERPRNAQYLQFIAYLRRELVHLGKLTSALKKEFRERDSRTPLLLPLRNFDSVSLNELLIQVQKLRPQVDDYDVPLRALVDASGPKSVKEAKRRSFFENRKSIRFYGPSKAGARHGVPASAAPHNSACLVNAYFRLGARFDVRFHYDCQLEKGRISGVFPNCHDGEDTRQSETHLNISPNDFVR